MILLVSLVKIVFLWLDLSSRKASLKDKVFPSPSKAPITKGRAQSPGAEDGAEGSPSKVAKTWSFTEKNRGPKHTFKVRGTASRQNSEGKGTSHSTEHLSRFTMSVKVHTLLTVTVIFHVKLLFLYKCIFDKLDSL